MTGSNILTRQSNDLKASLGDRAYDIIQEKIITMGPEPGQHVDEKKLVRELEIGRTPVQGSITQARIGMPRGSPAKQGIYCQAPDPHARRAGDI